MVSSDRKKKNSRRSRKRIKERKKNQEARARREKGLASRRPLYSSARGLIRLLKPTLLVIAGLLLLAHSVIAILSIFSIGSGGVFLTILWCWARDVVLILFAATFLHVALIVMGVVLDLADQNRGMRAALKEVVPTEEPEDEEESADPGEVEEDADDSEAECEGPPPPGSEV